MRLVRILAGVLSLLAITGASALAESNGAGITAVFQGNNNQLEVFWVDATGAVRDVYKDNDNLWHQPFSMTGPNAAPPGAHLTAVQQVQDDQLQLYWAGGDGALNIMWKSHNGAWHGPNKLGGPGFATPGSPLAAVWQPVRHEMHVFGLTANGTLNFVYNKDLKWAGWFAMTAPNFGVAGEQIAAVYQPEHEHLEVFAVGPDGAINVKWKAYDGQWFPEGPLTPPGTAPVRAALSAVYQPLHAHLEVFWLDDHGGFNSLGKSNDGAWSSVKTSRSGSGIAGAPLKAIFQPLHNHMEVFTIASDGSLVDSWKAEDGAWAQPFSLTRPGIAPPGGDVAGVFQPLHNHMEVFWLDAVGTVWDVWKKDDGAWEQPFPLTSAGGTAFLTPGICTRFLAGFSKHGTGYREASYNNDGKFFDSYKLAECEGIMGITGSCPDGYINYDKDDKTGRFFLYCVKYVHPDNALEQIKHIGRGVAQGLATAFVASAPYLGMALEGISCVEGVVYACGVLALDIADKADAFDDLDIDPKVKDVALGFAHAAGGCVSGDVVACADLGSRAVSAASGANIPGGDIARGLQMGTRCADGDFAACARLGQMAADAAGVKFSGQVFDSIADGADCLDSIDDPEKSKSACRQLGIKAAQVAINQTKVLNGVVDIQQAEACIHPSTADAGAAACAQIGLKAARAAGVPLDLFDQLQQKTIACAQRNVDACVAIGTEAARAAGVPLDDFTTLQRCANGDRQVCTILASKMVGIPLGKAQDIENIVRSASKCVNGDTGECTTLAKAAIVRYAPVNQLPAIVLSVLPASWGKPAQAASGPPPGVIGVVTGRPKPGSLRVATTTTDQSWLPPKPASAIPAVPQPGPGITFAGQWVTAVQNGVAYTMTFTQDAAGHVSGKYDAGTISDGVVIGTDLYAHWKQGSASGTLLFSLAADHAVFAGLWTLGEKAPSPASSNGTWDGYRADVFTGTPNPGSFVGTWTVTRGIVGFPVDLQANGASITAAYNTGFAQGTLSGGAVRQYAKTDVLSFTWDEKLSKGTGAFYLYPDGKRISGILHTSDKALGTWTGVRAAPPVVVMQPPPVVQPPPAVDTPPPVAQAPPVKIPRGACPGPEAVATQGVTVRNGISGTPIPPPLQGGTLVSCIACDQNWCLVANANPHATVSRKYLDFDFAVAQQPPTQEPQPAPEVQPTPPPEPEIADFSGDWNVMTSTGVNYHLTINQLKEIVSGTFVDQVGHTGGVNGGIGGRVMGLSIVINGGGPGSGQFALAPDGNSMDGGFQLAPMPILQPYQLAGTWHGTRGFQPFPAPAPAAPAPDPMGGVDSQIDYGGCGGCGKADVPDVVK